MRKTLASFFMGVASLILIFCIVFTCIQLVMRDDEYIENEFIQLGNYTEIGMTLGDICKAAKQLIAYMQGEADTIQTTVTINGVVTEMYQFDIEFTHMQEVQTLWLKLVKLRNLGVMVAALLFLLGALIRLNLAWRLMAGSYITAVSLVALFGAFFGTWASLDFSSFWTAFHHLIFPGNTNWLLPAESRMIQMLNIQFFSDIVRKIAITAIIPLAMLLAGSILVLIFVKKPMKKKAVAARNPSKPKWIEPEGPDLLAEHRMRNMTVSAREQLEEEEARTEEIRSEVESFGQNKKKKKRTRHA